MIPGFGYHTYSLDIFCNTRLYDIDDATKPATPSLSRVFVSLAPKEIYAQETKHVSSSSMLTGSLAMALEAPHRIDLPGDLCMK